MVNIFNLFITYGDTFLPSPTSYDELYYEIIRVHQIFDNLYSMGESEKLFFDETSSAGSMSVFRECNFSAFDEENSSLLTLVYGDSSDGSDWLILARELQIRVASNQGQRIDLCWATSSEWNFLRLVSLVSKAGKALSVRPPCEKETWLSAFHFKTVHCSW